MAKKTKITAEAITKAMNLHEEKTIALTIGCGDMEIELRVKARLSLAERAKMISDIVDMVFVDDENGTRYCPAFKTFAIEYNIVNYFTNVALPADPNKANKFLEMTELAHQVIQLFPDDYIGHIISDSIEAIEHRKQEILKESKLDNLIGGALNLIHALNQKVKDADISQIMEFVEKNMPEFKGQVEQLISSYSAETDVNA